MRYSISVNSLISPSKNRDIMESENSSGKMLLLQVNNVNFSFSKKCQIQKYQTAIFQQKTLLFHVSVSAHAMFPLSKKSVPLPHLAKFYSALKNLFRAGCGGAHCNTSTGEAGAERSL